MKPRAPEKQAGGGRPPRSESTCHVTVLLCNRFKHLRQVVTRWHQAITKRARSACRKNIGLFAGLQHPISGLDHVTAMIAVGLWGAQLGLPAIGAWAAPRVSQRYGHGAGRRKNPGPCWHWHGRLRDSSPRGRVRRLTAGGLGAGGSAGGWQLDYHHWNPDAGLGISRLKGRPSLLSDWPE